jgi:heme A synthase
MSQAVASKPTIDHGARVEPTRALPRWLHRWAILTAAATIVLLGLGSAVTTFHAGMADLVWPTPPTALLQASAEQLGDLRFVIEHSHRLAGWLVGGCAIVLAAWLWLAERRRWLAWLGLAAMVGVGVQGLIGGLRVTEDVRWGLEFRILHGCFAEVVLALMVSVAVFTSPSWVAQGATSAARDRTRRLRRSAGLALALVYLQIVFGVLLRHTYNLVAQRLHLLTAFAAVAAVVWLLRVISEQHDRVLTLAAGILACILGLQLLLGVEAWMVQFSSGSIPDALPLTAQRVAVRTAHVLGGSLLLAAMVTTALLTYREPAATADPLEAGA